MAEMIDFPAPSATVVAPWRRGAELLRSRLQRLYEIVDSGSKVFRMNPVIFSLWFLFPLFLVVTSDWIGLLVVFQAAAAALRLQKAPVAKKLTHFSPSSAPANRIRGEYRVLR